VSAARECFEEALAMRRAMADRRGIGIALSGLALAGIVGGEYDRAGRELEEARELFRRAGDRWGLVSALWRTADLAVARGDLGEALAALDIGLAAARETERTGWIEVTSAMRAEVARRREQEERSQAGTDPARPGTAGSDAGAAQATSGAGAQSRDGGVQSGRKEGSRTNRPVPAKNRRRT
jgi:hypothetical protein